MLLVCAARANDAPTSAELVDRASTNVAKFLDQFSQVRCTESVVQEKIGRNGKIEQHGQSAFDYLVIMSNSGGELSLQESRLAMKDSARKTPGPAPLLVTNGFATLFLIFHPSYVHSFTFADEGVDVLEGATLRKLSFRAVRGMRSPAVLALRGREFPLALAGTVWLDAQTGAIHRIRASLAESLQDIGLTALASDTLYAQVGLKDYRESYFPVTATIEVETPRQHWRNTHRFASYQEFAVSADELPQEHEELKKNEEHKKP